jgi:DNA-directed RNA polymerase specialized sigma24 family protein
LSTVDKFINLNYKDLQEAAKRISGNDKLWEELLHYSLDEFLRKKNVDDIIISGGAKFFIIKILTNSWNSSTSPFYYTYKKQDVEFMSYHEIDPDRIPEEEDNTLELYDKVTQELNKLSWYDKKLFQTYVDESHSISSLSRATGIPRTSISLSINRIRKHIKKSI